MGSIYLIPDREHIEICLQLANQYNAHFEYNDFFIPNVLDDEAKVNELISFYKGLNRDRSQDTLHGVFFDITIHSIDSKIYEVSKFRIKQCLDIAKELGIRGVIFHTNTIPNFKDEAYMKNWVIKNQTFWKEMLREYDTLEIFIENMFDEEPDMLYELATCMKDETRFGICFDYAHANVFGDEKDTERWVKLFAPYIKHMHINDNDFHVDLHQSVGKGAINWEKFNQEMKKYNVQSSVLLEVKNIETQKDSLEYMKKKQIYPFL